MKKDRFCLKCRVIWDKDQLGFDCPCCNAKQFFTCNAGDLGSAMILDNNDLTLSDFKEVTEKEFQYLMGKLRK